MVPSYATPKSNCAEALPSFVLGLSKTVLVLEGAKSIEWEYECIPKNKRSFSLNVDSPRATKSKTLRY